MSTKNARAPNLSHRYSIMLYTFITMETVPFTYVTKKTLYMNSSDKI